MIGRLIKNVIVAILIVYVATSLFHVAKVGDIAMGFNMPAADLSIVINCPTKTEVIKDFMLRNRMESLRFQKRQAIELALFDTTDWPTKICKDGWIASIR